MTDAARRARMMALAPADNAVLGRDLHHDAVALGHGANTQRYLLARRHAEAGGIGLYVDDLHFAPLPPAEEAAPRSSGQAPRPSRSMGNSQTSPTLRDAALCAAPQGEAI